MNGQIKLTFEKVSNQPEETMEQVQQRTGVLKPLEKRPDGKWYVIGTNTDVDTFKAEQDALYDDKDTRADFR